MRWIVVANRSDAKVLKHTNKRLSLIKEYKNSLGRLRDKDMQDDHPGQSRAKYMGSAPHNLEKENSPHEQAADQFAKKIFKVLNLEMKRNHNLNLIIVAEANFLGKIKSHFKSKSKKSRVEWVEKDLKGFLKINGIN